MEGLGKELDRVKAALDDGDAKVAEGEIAKARIAFHETEKAFQEQQGRKYNTVARRIIEVAAAVRKDQEKALSLLDEMQGLFPLDNGEKGAKYRDLDRTFIQLKQTRRSAGRVQGPFR